MTEEERKTKCFVCGDIINTNLAVTYYKTEVNMMYAGAKVITEYTLYFCSSDCLSEHFD
ncbi:MAG: hypothetical protein ACTSPI_16530 [Candidatus Heimdallarchaeaceae archaeon]